ncbi:MAG: General stress protein 69 [Alphaproteobacteria bacterium MarineAlpha3_Bin5]|nr:aldo/keto reductase [Magnetovibrio sp.]PPR79372.1 MAG: General stress protein 69 [Alphaproteobacteria bacterium MarineAlpha3_Bin5]
MKMNFLGHTGISVSRICLGSMTFGNQNNEEEGHAQLDMAFEHGVNFIDTAEMYPIPRDPETQGKTEEIIGSWIKKRRNREKLVLATKITGPSSAFSHIRNGDLKFGKKQFEEAVNLSLRRLQTDYIDLYQTHWPERPGSYFGQLEYKHIDGSPGTSMEEQLEAVNMLIEVGKVRAFGSSNETPWGQMKLIECAARLGVCSIASIQNPYNLLNRAFEVGHAEISIRENCGLLAYSPLGFGTLTGKYLEGKPPKSRLALFPEFKRYTSARSVSATARYVDLALTNGLDPAQMAIAFVSRRRFTTSAIIGATTLQQLKKNLDSEYIELTDEVSEGIAKIHSEFPNPAP